MKKRQIIIIISTVAILAIGKFGMDFLAAPAEKQVKTRGTSTTTVFASTVANMTIPVYMQSSGVLNAVNRAELFSEVQGVMEADNGKFKAGNAFKKGDLLVDIRSKDQEAQLFSQRSAFVSSISGVMPDIKADFPNDFKVWEDYLQNFSNNDELAELPKSESEKLKLFLVGRGIYSSYHNLKNIEIIHSKYQIRAPFDGVLIAANVTPGTLIRPGQALGTFIQPTHFELETSIDALSAERLAIGQSVRLKMKGLKEKSWNGKIARIVKAIDTQSQLSTFFVSVKGKDLKEGMFMEATVTAKNIKNSYELPRAALINETQVFIVKNGALALYNINIEHTNKNTVIVTGLKDGDKVLTKISPSAYEGMKVSVYQESK